MYKIKLQGEFTYPEFLFFSDNKNVITLDKVNEELMSAGGQDLDVKLSSNGGFVDVGLDIMSSFKDYKRNYPTAKMILRVGSYAASMASMLMAGDFWDSIEIEDITAWMAHNPINGIIGDYKEMRKNSETLERTTKLYANTYSKKSGKSQKEMLKIMDETTYLFGQEIVDAGFADRVVETSSTNKDRSSMIAQSENKVKSIMCKIKEFEGKQDYLEKAVAKLDVIVTPQTPRQPETPASGGNDKLQEGSFMDMKELREKHPEIYAESMKAGQDAEKARVKSLIEMKKKKDFEGLTMITDRIDDAIANGESIEDARMAVMAILAKPQIQASIESPGAIGQGVDDGQLQMRAGKKMTPEEVAAYNSEA